MTAVHSPAPEELMSFLDGELPAAAARDVQGHLARCESCQQLADNLRRVSMDMRAWQVDDPPATLRPPDAARAGRVPVPPLAFTRRLLRIAQHRAFAASAAVLLVVVGVVVFRPSMKRAVGKGEAFVAEREGGYGVRVDALSDRAPETAVTAGSAIARTVTLRIAAIDFDAVRPAIDRLIGGMNGFVGTIDSSDSGDGVRSLRATLRIPASRLDEALAVLRALGRVTNETQQAEDVGTQIVDLDIRLANARLTEKRLNDLLLTRTGKIAEVLETEREIARVRTEIEQLDAERKHLDRRVSYATVSLDVIEQRRAGVTLGPVPLSTRLRLAFSDGFQSALTGLVDAALFVLRAGPSLVLWGMLLGVPAWLVVRRRRAGHRSAEL